MCSDDSEVIVVTPDDVAPVAYLKLKRLHLEKKFPVSMASLRNNNPRNNIISPIISVYRDQCLPCHLSR